MKAWSKARMERFLNLEGILILVAIGIDLFIECLIARDWLPAVVILAGFGVIGALYWHSLRLDALFADVHRALQRFHTPERAPQAQPADVPLSLINDRPVIRVSNFGLSKNFYEAALGELGYALVADFPALSIAAFGIGPSADIWIKGDGVENKLRASFSATSSAAVNGFYETAMQFGGRPAEAPGARPDRGAGFYAAAAYDPDGYVVEAVFRDSAAAGV